MVDDVNDYKAKLKFLAAVAGGEEKRVELLSRRSVGPALPTIIKQRKEQENKEKREERDRKQVERIQKVFRLLSKKESRDFKYFLQFWCL